MVTDPIDTLLDASAPARLEADPAGIRAMIVDARAEVPVRKKGRRTALVGGVLALLLVGGAGVATASSDWLWGDGLENPDRSYAYTAPTWGQCEIRYSGYDTHNLLIQADVNRIIDEWFATTDVEAAASPYVDKYLTEIEESHAHDPEDVQDDPRRADLDAWLAHDQALGEALYNELVAHGYDSSRLAGAEAHSQLHCEGEDWGGEGGEQ